MAANNSVVSHQEWLAARTALLAREKEFTRLRDELNRHRRELPWEAVTSLYAFEGPSGTLSLADLFEHRSQLIVYHFMFDPAWEAGCPICSFWADNFDNVIQHLNQRDVTMVAVSRAPYRQLEAYRRRMGWTFTWVSSFGTDFNFDYNVSFTPDQVEKKEAFYNFTMQNPRKGEREAVSVFYRDSAGDLYHTYSAYARGIDLLNTAYNYLDLVPRGRDEGTRGPFWVRRHDEYGR
jgi:predicted dithiol-disulfide oxidoreductase (DUF899 family)